MALNARTAASGGKEFVQMAPGTYPCRLVQVLDLGLQKQSWKGEEKPNAYEIGLTYEFTDEFMEDDDGNPMEDKPRHLTETMVLYNLKVEKAKSTARYNAIDPGEKAEGDWEKLLGSPCMVTVVINPGSDGRKWEKIAAVGPMREKDAAKLPKLVNQQKVLDLVDPDLEVFRSLNKWMQERVASNLEFSGSALQKLLDDTGEKVEAKETKSESKEELDDEIPF